MRAYRDHIFVVKLGGDVAAEAEVLDHVAAQIALLSSLGIRLVVVHGGGPQATALSRRLGFEPRMVDGRRVTDDAALEVAKMVYAGQLNVDLLASLRSTSGPGGRPERGGRRADHRPPAPSGHRWWTTAAARWSTSATWATSIEWIPASSSPCWRPASSRWSPAWRADEDGEVYNVNADTVAESLAVALKAQKLIFLTGAPGVLRDRNDPSTLVTFADPEELAAMIATGVIHGGMLPKVEACIRAATSGVERTHIIGGRAPDALLLEVFTGSGCGTMIVGRKEKAAYLDVDLAD